MKQSLSRVIIPIYLVFFAAPVFSQNTNTGILSHKGYVRYALAGIGLSNQSFYDEAISAVRYNKTGASMWLGHVKKNQRKYSEINLQASYLGMQTKRSTELLPMKVKTLNGKIDYRRLQNINAGGKFDIHAGGHFSMLLSYKNAPQLDNSAIVYDFAVGLGASGTISHTYRLWGKSFLAAYDLDIPLIAYIVRPLYLNRIEFIDPENNFINDAFAAGRMVTVNRYLRFNSRLSLSYPLQNGNMIRLSYHWDFYTMKTINRVYAANNMLSLVIMFNY